MTKEQFLKQIEQEREELELNESLGEGDLFVCCVCGSLDIEEMFWVGTNTGQVSDSTDSEEYFCNTCNNKYETYPISVEKFTKNLDV